MAGKIQVPPVKWAERKDRVFVVIDLIDVTKAESKVTLESTPIPKLTFAWKQYAVDIELAGDVDTDKSKWGFNARSVLFDIRKKTDGYWNKLVKSGKPTWLTVDWARWKDEDDEDDKKPDMMDLGGGNGFNFDQMGMGGGLGAEDHDSDDEDMPDLEGDAGKAGTSASAGTSAAPAEPAAAATTTTAAAEAAKPEEKKEEEPKKEEKPAETAAPAPEAK